MTSSKVVNIILTILEEEQSNIYINDVKIFEKFENYIRDLGDVKMSELSNILENMAKDRQLKRSVRGGNFRYSYKREP